jgi:hypothetical protein
LALSCDLSSRARPLGVLPLLPTLVEGGQDSSEERRFSPPVVISEEVRVIAGSPDPEKISTSYVERENLSMRMGMRRFTRRVSGRSRRNPVVSQFAPPESRGSTGNPPSHAAPCHAKANQATTGA